MIGIFEFWRTRLRETPIAASPVFSLFYVVLIPTYFENLSHLQLEGFESSKFLSKILVAKKKTVFFFRNQDFGKEWLKQILKYFVSNMLQLDGEAAQTGATLSIQKSGAIFIILWQK